MGLRATGNFIPLKISSDVMGNNRNLPVYSVVPQPSEIRCD